MYQLPKKFEGLKNFMSTRPIICYVQVTDNVNVMAKFHNRFPDLPTFDGIYQTTRPKEQGHDISVSIYCYFPEFSYHQKAEICQLIKGTDFGMSAIKKTKFVLKPIRPTDKLFWSKRNKMYYCVVNSLDLFETFLHDKMKFRSGMNNAYWLHDDRMGLLMAMKFKRRAAEDE